MVDVAGGGGREQPGVVRVADRLDLFGDLLDRPRRLEDALGLGGVGSRHPAGDGDQHLAAD